MKKYWRISPRRVTIGLAGWLALSIVLTVLSHSMDLWLPKLALFLCLAFLPGVAGLRALKVNTHGSSINVLYSFGLSILVIMLSGLFANQLLPLFGVMNPLETWWALCAWSCITALIISISAMTNHGVLRLRKWTKIKVSKLTWLLAPLSVLLLCIATAGAFRLNNGGDGFIALIGLCFAAGLIVGIFLSRHHLSNGLIVWLIFSISLAILLMTSLRGWDITGHDIEREFHVYTLTHAYALWDIALDRDPYNACLSITILPEMFTRLLDVSGVFVFKVLLQIIFAACPAILYILLKRYVPVLGALTGSILFICYPTFINDSAMLTRQGIAYFFFALALLILTIKTQQRRDKLLFSFCALGAILSHYSTAYMFVGLFAVAAICKLLLTRWLARHKRSLPRVVKRSVLSPLFAVGLFAATFMWYTQITATSSGLTVTLSKSLANIPEIFSSDNKSSDTSTALLFANHKTQADVYNSYLAETQPRTNANTTQYIPALTDDNLPLTPLGAKARAIGIDPAIITSYRQMFAKLLQVLAIIGVAHVTYKLLRKKYRALSPDFVCLSLAGIFLLALMVILPVLSVHYGILRAFQQSLIFLTLPIVILLMALTKHLSTRLKTVAAPLGIIFLFLLFTGVFAQTLGGVSPNLSMNNSGAYYGLYSTSTADQYAFQWLRLNVDKRSDVRAANFHRARMHDPKYPFERSGILPSQIGTDTYVYLDPAQVRTQKNYAYHDSSPLIMTFPLEYYDQMKNQIYSTTSTRIYR